MRAHAHEITALNTDNALCGKVDQMIKHLLECNHVSTDTRSQVQKYQSHREELKGLTQAISKSSADGSAIVVAPHVLHSSLLPVVSGTLSDQHQEEFNRNICDIFVACGLPWNEAGNPILKRVLRKWIPAASIPNRQTLSDHVLPERVAEVEAHAKMVTRGKLAMGQCDGWKNIAWSPIVGMLMTVQGQVSMINRVIGVAYIIYLRFRPTF